MRNGKGWKEGKGKGGEERDVKHRGDVGSIIRKLLNRFLFFLFFFLAIQKKNDRWENSPISLISYVLYKGNKIKFSKVEQNSKP